MMCLEQRQSGKTVNTREQTSTGRVPLVDQITEMLVREIHAGILPDGERLPPERQMAERLHISVGTLRKALATLEKQGLLRRVQGSGNYIHNVPDANNVYALFRLERIDGPATPSASLLSVRRMNKAGYVPYIGPARQAFRFRRIRKLGDANAALEEIWLDGRYASSIDPSTVSNSLYQFFRDQLNVRITRVEDRVGVATLPAWTPTVFSEDLDASWGFIERISRDHEGQLAEYSRTWFDPLTVRFVSR